MSKVVAGVHARRVAKILREKYGHEVITEKIRQNKQKLLNHNSGNNLHFALAKGIYTASNL